MEATGADEEEDGGASADVTAAAAEVAGDPKEKAGVEEPKALAEEVNAMPLDGAKGAATGFRGVEVRVEPNVSITLDVVEAGVAGAAREAAAGVATAAGEDAAGASRVPPKTTGLLAPPLLLLMPAGALSPVAVLLPLLPKVKSGALAG